MMMMLLRLALVACVATISSAQNVDCVVSAWSLDAPCPVSCGGAVAMATRSITTPQQGTGKPCPELVDNNYVCNSRPCPDDPFIMETRNGSLVMLLPKESDDLVLLRGAQTPVPLLATLKTIQDVQTDAQNGNDGDLLALSNQASSLVTDVSTLKATTATQAAVDLKADLTLVELKANRTELASKADATDIQQVLDTLAAESAFLRGNYTELHGDHNDTLIELLAAFDRLDTDLANNVGVANAVGVNVTRVEVGLDEVKSDLSQEVAARLLLEATVASQETVIARLESSLAGGDAVLPLPFGRGSVDWQVDSSQVSTDQWALTANALIGQSMLTIASCSDKIVPFSELFLHQTQHPQGASGTAGTYEFAIVASVVPAGRAGCHLFLTAPLQNTYITGQYAAGVAPEAAQIVLVPNYRNIVVTSGTVLSAQAWNGMQGGIIVLKATGNVTVEGSIHATGRGFRGASRRPNNADFRWGYAGESEIATLNSNSQTDGRTLGSGGGPGNGQGGGYGGAHASVGTTPQRGGCDSGIPTAPITVGDADITRAYFGGSGASSGVHNGGGRDGNTGGASGGIIMLFAEGTITVNGDVTASGLNGGAGYFTSVHQQPIGGGGGGAGGTVWAKAAKIVNANKMTATGGLGGAARTAPSCSPGGFGGTGGVGRVKAEEMS